MTCLDVWHVPDATLDACLSCLSLPSSLWSVHVELQPVSPKCRALQIIIMTRQSRMQPTELTAFQPFLKPT